MASLKSVIRQKLVSALPVPLTGEVTYGFKSDGFLYAKNSAGTETLIGAPGTAGPTGPAGATGVGNEMGYAERLTSFTTTNTTFAATTTAASTGAVISSLSVTVVGTGRAVSVEFYCPALSHSTPGTGIFCWLVTKTGAGAASATDANAQFGFISPSTTSGSIMNLRRRLVLTNGTTYVFTVGVSGVAAGTVSVYGATNQAVTSLSVTQL